MDKTRPITFKGGPAAGLWRLWRPPFLILGGVALGQQAESALLISAHQARPLRSVQIIHDHHFSGHIARRGLGIGAELLGAFHQAGGQITIDAGQADLN